MTRRIRRPFQRARELQLDRFQVFVCEQLLAFQCAGCARDGIFLFPFGELRKLAVLRRIAFVMAAHAVGQTFDEYRSFASAAFLHGVLHPVAHGEEIVAVDGARRNSISLRMLR